MKRSLTKHILSGLFGSGLLLFGLLAAPPAATGQPALFYQDTKRGWFWYEDPPIELEIEEMEQEIPARPIPSLHAFSMEELWDMHPDDFHTLLMDLQKEAVRRPTEENMLEYITIQDIARRKALAFTNVAAYVTQKHGEFDQSQAYPVAMPGVRARVQQQRQEIVGVVAAARHDHALLFFTDPSCTFCVEQQKILGYFTARHGWEVKPIDIMARPDLAVQFGVQRTPTLLLI
ncbi:conjugal transfer protein TraF, partial [Desulfurivibrio sp. D14AmB]|uniref:conjugal transfer protein TraF n=1 Tax=Desulfurivibrio sp. D14AmB TaxID=3374370 RepID=UPI00376F1C70